VTAMAGPQWCPHACGRRPFPSSRCTVAHKPSCSPSRHTSSWLKCHLAHGSRASSTFRCCTLNRQVHTLRMSSAAVLQTLMDFESLNEITFPFFSACLLEQRSPHTRVAHTRLQSRGWLAALCAPREVGAAAAPVHPVPFLSHSTATFAYLLHSTAALAAGSGSQTASGACTARLHDMYIMPTASPQC
jgi:hypothetical protein